MEIENFGPRPQNNMEATPLMVGGVLSPRRGSVPMWSPSTRPRAKRCGTTGSTRVRG